MPLLWLSFFFLCGILLADFQRQPLYLWLALAFLALGWAAAGGYLARRRAWVWQPAFLPHPPLPYAVLLTALFLGAARFQTVQPQRALDALANYNDGEQPLVIEGLVVDLPDEREGYTNLYIQADQLHPSGELQFMPVQGRLLARVPPGEWRYGDRVRLQGWLKTPPEDEEFSYRSYLARNNTYSYLSCAQDPQVVDDPCARLLLRDQGSAWFSRLAAFRERALHTVYALFPDPAASLVAGIVLGVESGIPQDVYRAFRDTGTAHIIAISGANIALLVAFCFTLLLGLMGKRRRFHAVGLSALVIGLYALLVGGEAAVLRAALMGFLALLAKQLGRPESAPNSLFFVAAVMAFFNPYILWDVGFQLSFMATLGLVLYGQPLTDAALRLGGRWLPAEAARPLSGPLSEYFLLTLAAQVTTLGVTVYHFQRLSLSSLLANPLILPAQPPLMILSALAVFLGTLWLPLGRLFALLAWPFAAYTIAVVEWLAQARWMNLSLGRVSLLAVALFYALLFAWTFYGERLRLWVSARTQRLPSRGPALGLIVVGALAIIVWQARLAAPDGRLHLLFLDVGSGDALLVQTPTGRWLLVDGGPSPSRLGDALGRRLPFGVITGERPLDFLVVAAAGDEQLGALPSTLERFPPARVLWAGPSAGSFSALRLQQRLADLQIPLDRAQVGQSLDLGDGARLQVLAAGGRGAVLRIQYAAFSALLPVGLDFESLEALQNDRSLGPVNILLLSEGGYAPLNPSAWIERWRPQALLLSVAAGDPLGRPDAAVLQSAQGYTLLRTDRNGWIEVTTDGERMWIEVQMPSETP